MVDKSLSRGRIPCLYQGRPVEFQAQNIAYHSENALQLLVGRHVKRLQQWFVYAITTAIETRHQGQRGRRRHVGVLNLFSINVDKQGLVAKCHFVCYDMVHVVGLLILVVFQTIKKLDDVFSLVNGLILWDKDVAFLGCLVPDKIGFHRIHP